MKHSENHQLLLEKSNWCNEVIAKLATKQKGNYSLKLKPEILYILLQKLQESVNLVNIPKHWMQWNNESW